MTKPISKRKIINKAPSGFATEILDWISAGKTLTSYCQQLNKPTYASIRSWLDSDPKFARQFDLARDIGQAVIFEQCLDISEEMPLDEDKLSPIVLSWQKQKIDTRLKILSRWNPKKYCERRVIAGDETAPIAITEIKRVIIDGSDDF